MIVQPVSSTIETLQDAFISGLERDRIAYGFHRHIDIRHSFVHLAVRICLHGDRPVLHLETIWSHKRGFGHGSEALEDLCRRAAALNLPVRLSPWQIDPKGPSEKVLRSWYMRHGFFAESGEWLLWMPHETDPRARIGGALFGHSV